MELTSANNDESNKPGSISVDIERHILEEFHSELINNMSSMDISFLMMTEQLLLSGEYKTFATMMNQTEDERNEFLLSCLVKRQQGFLTKFQSILVKTSLEQIAEAINRMMAVAASNRSAYEPEEIWKEEKRKLENEVMKLKRRIKRLEKENNNLIQCMARIQSDISKCRIPIKLNQLQPESELSSDTDPTNFASSSESNTFSSGTIEPQEGIPATLGKPSIIIQSMPNSFTNLQPHYPSSPLPILNQSSAAATSLSVLKNPVKPFNVQGSCPNSLLSASVTSLSSSSDKSTGETEDMKPPTTQTISSTSSIAPTIPVPSRVGNQTGQTNIASRNEKGSQSQASSAEDPKLIEWMKKRRDYVDTFQLQMPKQNGDIFQQ